MIYFVADKVLTGLVGEYFYIVLGVIGILVIHSTKSSTCLIPYILFDLSLVGIFMKSYSYFAHTRFA